jgi:hypothetical protein
MAKNTGYRSGSTVVMPPVRRIASSRTAILTNSAGYTLGLLHAELAGKLLANKREAIRLRTAMMQVEAVVKSLSNHPGLVGDYATLRAILFLRR